MMKMSRVIGAWGTGPPYMLSIMPVYEADTSILLRLARSVGCKPDRVIVRIVRLHPSKRRLYIASDDASATYCGVCSRLKH